MTILEVDQVVARHGLLEAVRQVSFTVADGDVVALVGANGAGKSTLLRTIAGAHPVTTGRILFEGHDITAMPAHRRVRAGIALVPEGRKLFPDLTVEENLRVAGRRGRPGPWTVDTVIKAFPMLAPLRRQQASTLSGGQQQAAAIGRALMTNPRLLLLDEVSLGLAPIAVDAVYDSLATLIADGATIILVEQDLQRAMEVSRHLICLLEGRVSLQSTSADVTRETVTTAYFGTGPAGTVAAARTPPAPANPGQAHQ